MKPENTDVQQGQQSEVEQQRIAKNREASEAYIKANYPNEVFISEISELQSITKYSKGLIIPANVKVAASRLPVSSEQRSTLRKELQQAEILEKKGNSVYLIPEHGPHGKKLLDAVVNGQLYEFKTVTGKAEKIERRFALAKEKGSEINVFISVELDISKDEARRRIAQVLSRHPDYTGKIIVSIPSEETSEAREKNYNVFFWDSKDLR